MFCPHLFLLMMNAMYECNVSFALVDVCNVKVQGLKSYNSVPILFHKISEPVVKAVDCHTFLNCLTILLECTQTRAMPATF